MGSFKNLLIGLGLGAGLMYYLDPQLGRTRQAKTRDQFTSYRRRADQAVDKGVRDLRNRTRGALAEAMSAVSNEPVSDSVLAERVRSRLGFATPRSGAIQVDVMNGNLTLRGDALRHEADGILKRVSAMRGINRVENQLNLHDEPGNIPSLNVAENNGANNEMWSPSTRLAAGLGGGLLTLYGMGRGGFMGRLISLGGMALAVRSAANRKLKPMVGMGEEGMGIRVVKSIQIPASIDEVYNFWADFTNFEQFMGNVEEITKTGDNHSHWVVKGPAGTNVEFDAVTTRNIPNEVIAWETVPGSTVQHQGEVRFRQTGDQNTQVNVRMHYTPPAGVVGHAVASFFGKDPKSQMDQDLMRLKALFTEGESAGIALNEIETGREGEERQVRRQSGTAQGGMETGG